MKIVLTKVMISGSNLAKYETRISKRMKRDKGKYFILFVYIHYNKKIETENNIY